jgi:hypothetical protein
VNGGEVIINDKEKLKELKKAGVGAVALRFLCFSPGPRTRTSTSAGFFFFFSSQRSLVNFTNFILRKKMRYPQGT